MYYCPVGNFFKAPNGTHPFSEKGVWFFTACPISNSSSPVSRIIAYHLVYTTMI